MFPEPINRVGFTRVPVQLTLAHHVTDKKKHYGLMTETVRKMNVTENSIGTY